MKLYVACLASYTNGVLHGRWIDATSDADEMQAEVDAMLRDSRFPNVTVDCPVCEGEGVKTFHNSETGATRQDACPSCLGKGQVPSAEEFAIHDIDGLPKAVGEFTSLSDLAEMVDFIEDQDDEDVARAVLDECNGDVQQAREMMDNFCGVYGSFRDYADEAADEMIEAHTHGSRNDLTAITNYFDYDAFARDLQHDMTVLDVPDGVAVFHA